MLRKIRVLVVEDSLVFRELLVQNLNKDEGIEVVAAARDPFEARDTILKYQPDVMTLDIEMPRMDGIEFLQKLMPQYPMPVVMISSLSDRVFDAMNAGAVDFVAKPTSTERRAIEEFIRTELPVKIKIASIAKIHRRRTHAEIVNALHIQKPTGKCDLIAIGASTGGTEATIDVLQGLHKDVPGIVVVQHMPAGFTELYASRLNERCELEVREAKSGDIVRPGLVLLAPGGDQHMELIRQDNMYKIVLKKGTKGKRSLPVGRCFVFFGSQACQGKCHGGDPDRHGRRWCQGAFGDAQNGSHTIGQDETTCIVYGMPKVAYEIGAVEYQEKLPDIAKKNL